ncbi:LysR family transcriptional regulator [Anaerorhabdus furcosa]|uniref:DNA-binding transcriptional regulator, LysR family n=1 Tax=Anaerorhabdus furcosa TaxID=118967 RepID=A0A1T4MEI7_9FIRM|nr:LysR family transcriptional regulator [Anaerorhabdus furcosa]SJZ65301.1 DNA-binding transcriptional regulator, LysR family [Anaerorhabdus furcosa]
MTLRHLRIFVMVYQLGSITKAAEQLHLAQPAVSLAIKEMEEYYGIQLFDRLARRIYPTEIAHKLFDYALQIQVMFDEMEQNLVNYEILGTLRIGTTITIGNFILPTIIKLFKEKYPKTKVQVTINNSHHIENLLIENEVDLVLLEGRCHHKDKMIEIPFYTDELCLIVSKDHHLAKRKSVKLKDLENCDLLFREPGSAERDLLNSLFTANDVIIKPIWESVSTKALVRGVEKNLGVSILPYLMIKDDIKKKEIVRLEVEGIDLIRKFMVIYNKNKYLTESAQTFVQLCKDWNKIKGL